MTKYLVLLLLPLSLCCCTWWPAPEPPAMAPRLHPSVPLQEPSAASAAESVPLPTVTAAAATLVSVTDGTAPGEQVAARTADGEAAAATLPAGAALSITQSATTTGVVTDTALLEPASTEPGVIGGPVVDERVIGYSVQGRPITAAVFGSGPGLVSLVGGIHGGYEWNTILTAYQLRDYLQANPGAVPASLTVYVITSANPDGQALITGGDGPFTPDQLAADTRPGRLNANGVDLNRNWDCHWSPTATWGDTPVSGGSAPFSEPEAAALAAFLNQPNMQAVIFYHSAASGVFAGGCDGPFAPGEDLGRIYAAASGYPFQSQFTSYTVTGDATDWLARQGIPALTVEFYNHQDLDWEINLAGTLAVLQALGDR